MSITETRRDQIFPVLDAAQIETAKRFASGPARTFAPGEVVFDVGERNAPAWLVLEGSIDVVRRDGLKRETSITTHHVGSVLRRGQPAGWARYAGLRPGRRRWLHRAAVRRGAYPRADDRLGRSRRDRHARLHPAPRRTDRGRAASARVLVGRPGTPDLTRLQGFLRRNGYPCHRARRRQRRRGPRLVERFGVPPADLPLDALSQRYRAAATERCRSRRLSRHHAGSRSEI